MTIEEGQGYGFEMTYFAFGRWKDLVKLSMLFFHECSSDESYNEEVGVSCKEKDFLHSLKKYHEAVTYYAEYKIVVVKIK